MKVLIIGASGLVGSRFVELYKTSDNFLAPNHQELDITHQISVTKYVEDNKPDVIINFAAFTNVSEAENQRGDKNGSCWQINVEGVRNLLTTNIRLIQISTDMVFAGDNGPYSENQLAETESKKVTWYGFTKGEAERLADKQTILRIMYPVRSHFSKLDYLRKPLKLFNEDKLYPLFDDQQVSISFIDEVCDFLNKIINQNLSGTFHAASSDTSTPYELVCCLLTKLGKDSSVVQKSSLTQSVRYPKHGGLKVSYPFSSCYQIIDALVTQEIATA